MRLIAVREAEHLFAAAIPLGQRHRQATVMACHTALTRPLAWRTGPSCLQEDKNRSPSRQLLLAVSSQ